MGLLDDAIREHLELKRKHGAAEEELERQQAEALGPARREVAPAETQDENGAAEAAAAPGEQAAEAPDPHAEATLLHQPAPDDPAPDEPTPVEPAPVEPPPLEEAPAPHAEPQPPHEVEVEPADEVEHEVEAEPADEVEAEPVDEDLLPDDHEEGDESEPADPDVLEDTPEFLEETPEHDRLWFEQKPPRDFDFD